MKDNLAPVAPDSQLYSLLEFQLRLQLGAVTAKVVSAYSINLPQASNAFEKLQERMESTGDVESWIDCSRFSSPNSEDEILKRGFSTLSAKPIKFPVGRIKIHSSNSKAAAISSGRLIVCKLITGKSYNATEEFAQIGTIPTGYHSFYVDKESTGGTAPVVANIDIGKNKSADYVHEYFIKDPAQVLPIFVVNYEFDPIEEEKIKQRVICANCESKAATVFCQSDNAALCNECDKTLHASKLASRHVRLSLKDSECRIGISPCKIHGDKQIEFVCATCSLPVCINCKMIGNHSSGDNARHRLVSLSEAYSNALRENSLISPEDPSLSQRIDSIQKQINLIESRVVAIQQNASQVEFELNEMFNKIKNEIAAATRRKINILRGMAVEWARQASQIASLAYLMEREGLAASQSGISPIQYILDTENYTKVKTHILANQSHAFAQSNELQSDCSIQPDFRLSGSLRVSSSSLDESIANISVNAEESSSESNEMLSSIKAEQLESKKESRSSSPMPPPKVKSSQASILSLTPEYEARRRTKSDINILTQSTQPLSATTTIKRK